MRDTKVDLSLSQGLIYERNTAKRLMEDVRKVCLSRIFTVCIVSSWDAVALASSKQAPLIIIHFFDHDLRAYHVVAGPPTDHMADPYLEFQPDCLGMLQDLPYVFYKNTPCYYSSSTTCSCVHVILVRPNCCKVGCML